MSLFNYNKCFSTESVLKYTIEYLLVWVLSCSTAPALNVSQAAMRTLSLFSINQKQIFARLVLLPTPFTPQNVITYLARKKCFSLVT